MKDGIRRSLMTFIKTMASFILVGVLLFLAPPHYGLEPLLVELCKFIGALLGSIVVIATVAHLLDHHFAR